jgi:beta-lactamase regulating signal transducer with metallopeptidase domain/protocatechuate 3,4-dioxygenase beta subunit
MTIEALTERLALTLLHFAWQGFAIAGLTVFLGLVLRCQRPSSRYLLSLLALAIMAACPVLTFWYLGASPATSPATAQTTDFNQAVENEAKSGRPEVASTPPVRIESSVGVPGEGPELESWWHASQRWIVLAWMLGVSLVGARLLIGWAWLQRLKRCLQPAPEALREQCWRLCRVLNLRPPRIGLSVHLGEAIATGLFRPIVVIPVSWLTELPPSMLEAVLAHELAHLRRYDLWVNLLQRATETLLFYHPAVWWLSRRLRAQRELCCDDLAVAVTGDRLCYAQTLEQVGRLVLQGRQSGVLAMGGSRMSLLARVKYVLECRPAQSAGMPWLVGAVALIVPALALWWIFAPATSTEVATAIQVEELTGAVVDVDNQPVADVIVQVFKNRHLMDESIKTDAQGMFKVPKAWRNFDDARYVLVVKKHESLGWFDFTYSISAKVEDKFRIQMMPMSHVLRGQLTDAQGKPLVGLPVCAQLVGHPQNKTLWDLPLDQEPFAMSAVTDEQGMFSLKVPSGTGGVLVPHHPDWAAMCIRWLPKQLDLGRIEVPPGARIEGRVLDAKSKNPMPGVWIEAEQYQPTGDNFGWASAKTDKEGHYIIGGLAPGTYNVFFCNPGENRRLTAAAVEAVAVQPGKPGHADFKVMEGRLVTGKVIDDETGTPLANTTVGYNGAARPRSGAASLRVRTDATGTFRFYVPPSISLFYVADDLRNRLRDSASVIEVAADKDAPNLVLKAGPIESSVGNSLCLTHEQTNMQGYDPSYRAKIECRTVGTKPITRVQAQLVYSGSRNTERWSNRSGPIFDISVRYCLEGRKAFILVDAEGFAPAKSPEFVIAKTIPPMIVDLHEQTLVPVTGRVLDLKGKPVPGARVRTGRMIYYQEDEFPWGPETVTDSEGRFSLKHVALGLRFYVRIDKPGTGGAETDPTSVDNQEALLLPDIRIGPPNQSIKGQVLDNNRNAVAGAKIVYPGETVVETTSDSQGHFELRGLPAGKLALRVTAPGLYHDAWPVRAGATDAQITMVILHSEEDPAYQLPIKLRPTDGKPVTATEIWVLNPDKQQAVQGSIQNGNDFTINLLGESRTEKAGTVAVVVFPEGYVQPPPVLVEVRKNPNEVVIDLKPAPAVKVRGRIVDDGGQPLQGVAVKLSRQVIVGNKHIEVEPWYSEIGSGKSILLTNADGRFEFKGIAPGIRVGIYGNRVEYAGTRSIWATAEMSKDLVLPDTVLRKSTREVTGLVVTAANEPVAGARVWVNGMVTMKTVTDSAGRFQLHALPDGAVYIVIDSLDYDRGFRKITTGMKEVKVTLERQ